MFCPYCGRKVAPAQFCVYCGKKLPAPAGAETPVRTAEKKRPRTRTRRIPAAALVPAAALLSVAACAAALAACPALRARSAKELTKALCRSGTLPF